jgi:DNA mismatch endonuclease (patch repair protein)
MSGQPLERAKRATNPPPASSDEALRRMRNTLQRDTPPERRIRSALHARGARYRVQAAPLEDLRRRRADIVFRRERVAVFVDGCFWHSCPEHGTLPKANREWWYAKLAANRCRDADTDERLRAAGWEPVRVWEHDDPDEAACRILACLRVRRTRSTVKPKAGVPPL